VQDVLDGNHVARRGTPSISGIAGEMERVPVLA
jgi:hypothetical protein